MKRKLMVKIDGKELYVFCRCMNNPGPHGNYLITTEVKRKAIDHSAIDYFKRYFSNLEFFVS